MNTRQASITITEAIAEGASALRAAGVGEARREAGSLLAHVLARDRTFLLTHGDDVLAAADLEGYRRALARRARGEPLQYIRGRQEFYGLDFEVTPDVLIPRPETELLVETALELLRDEDAPRICDVGTGSGCVAVALLHERADAHAIALDISRAALSVAARNAARHGVGERISFVESDCFAALDAARERFRIVVSNPPYIPAAEYAQLQREVREHEPRPALTPDDADGLRIIRQILADALPFVEANGHLLIEIGFGQHEAVAALIDPRAWTLLDIRRDLQSIPRTVVIRKK
ncbi:MAG TPA: peptide chain release factor N(5)-glutamine methyltransferase [Pyrinomonadaceae bacterium]|jgi:release factor glutamine methyltransferase|nr:peptide chain release factor N(5)-glutamine methyltransferase [Pyrinomonadaceae bacterium]